MLSNSPEKTGKRFTAISAGTVINNESSSRWPKSKGNFVTGASTEPTVDATGESPIHNWSGFNNFNH